MTLQVFNSCPNGCTSATLERSVPIHYTTSGSTVDRWGFRSCTLSSLATTTRFQGRLAVSQDRGVVSVGGFDYVGEGVNLVALPQKREGCVVSLWADGRVNTTYYCRTRNTGSFAASGAWVSRWESCGQLREPCLDARCGQHGATIP